MKFTISQSALLPALTQVQRINSTKQILPILEMVKISAQKKSVVIETTDLTIGAKVLLLAKVEKEGSCIVPIKKLFAQVSTLPQQDLLIFQKDSILQVASQSINLSFPTGIVGDYPELPVIKGLNWRATKETLVKTNQLVLPSTAKDLVRPVLSSILFINTQNGLEVVATDGVRLSIYQSPKETLPIDQLLLPRRAVQEFLRTVELTDSEDFELKISEELQMVESQIGNTCLFSKLVSGEYPPYQKIIPESFQTSLRIDRLELEDNVKRSILIGGRDAGYFQLEINHDLTKLITRNQEGDAVESLISSREFSGEPIKIAFSSKFVLDMLRSVTDQEVVLAVNDPLKPVLFTIDSEPDFKFVIMPFKVRN